MKQLRQNKGKALILALYILIVFVSPIYTVFTYTPEKVSEMIDTVIPDEDDAFFRSYISLLRAQKKDEVFNLLSEEAKKTATPDIFEQFIEQFAGISDEVSIFGGHITENFEPSIKKFDMTYEIKNSDAKYPYMLVQIIAVDRGDGIKIDRAQPQYLEESIIQSSKFKLPTTDWRFFVAILVPLFVLFTAYTYLKNASQPKWWLFLVIILGSATISWMANGSYGIHFGFYGFLGQAGVWGPWLYSTPIPLGAVLYWIFRKKIDIKEIDNIK